MATQTRPHLKLGAALASAAVIAAGAPVVVPQASLPAPTALSSAAYELTSLADVFTFPPEFWTDVLFGSGSVGGYVSNSQETGLILDPWAEICDDNGGCFISGVSGVLYTFLNALINGVTYDPDTGGLQGGVVNWLNYLFEPTYQQVIGSGTTQSVLVSDIQAGLSAASQYLIQATVGGCTAVEDGGGPCVPPSEMAYINWPDTQLPPDELLYPNPIGQLTWAAYYGPFLLTLGWTRGLSAISLAAYGIPLAGPYIYGTIQAYLGQLLTPAVQPDTPVYFYEPGLSGILQFWVNVFNGSQGPPQPPVTTAATVDIPAAAAQVAEAGTGDVAAPPAPESASDPAPDAVALTGETRSAEVAADAPAEPTAESVRATAAADSAPAQQAGDAADGAENGTDTGPANDAADAADGTEVTAAPAADARGEAEKAPRRGLRGALEKATAKVASGVERATKGAASGRKAAAAAE